MTTVTSNVALDPRERRGTFLVVTASGSSYRITASKKASGQVEVVGETRFQTSTRVLSGGRPSRDNPHPDPIIRVGRPMILHPYNGGVVTSSVTGIYSIAGLAEIEIQALITRARSN